MSSDTRLIAQVIPRGSGRLLDLGGGGGSLRPLIERQGYQYVNLDLERFSNGEPTLVGDAHRLPFRDGAFDVVVSKETLEHFRDPWRAIDEVSRVLKPGGLFVVLVPFMHPFHENDLYRYSPLGLRHLLRSFEIVSMDSPLWIFTVAGMGLMELLRRIGLGMLMRPVREISAWLDGLFMRGRRAPASLAAAYRVVARKPLGDE